PRLASLATPSPYTTLFRSVPDQHGLRCRVELGHARDGRDDLVEPARVEQALVETVRRPVIAKIQPENVEAGTMGERAAREHVARDRKSTRLNSSHVKISYD